MTMKPTHGSAWDPEGVETEPSRGPRLSPAAPARPEPSRQITETLNSLLHVEMAACDRFGKILEREPKTDRGPELKRLFEDHRDAVKQLRDRLHQLGTPELPSDAVQSNLGVVVELAGDPRHDPTALGALREGEEETITGYENALGISSLDGETKALISNQLLPRAKERLPLLDRLLSEA